MYDRPTLSAELDRSCKRICALVSDLTPTQRQVPVMPGINPPIWELGHSAYFFERFIFQAVDGQQSLNPALDDVWDSFELVHEDRWQPGLFPGFDDTLRYFEQVQHKLQARIDSRPLTDQDFYLYRYGIHHLHMHTESLTWCRQTLGYPAPPPLQARAHARTSASNTAHPPAPQASGADDLSMPGGRYRIGVSAGSPDFAKRDFCFDNEKPAFGVEVAPFRMARHLVSNADFLTFVEAGGYTLPDCWGRAGRRWLAQTGQQHPLYWKRTDDGWMERIFDQWVPLDGRRPVRHISYHEATAWCAFAGRRLPTELEWEVAALGNTEPATDSGRLLPWGDRMETQRVDMDCQHLGMLPVDALSEGDSPAGFRQMIGTVWEWTSTTFLPYDGFAVDMYPLMSTLQFGTHKVTRGGSLASASALLRGTYRQAYHPDRNDVFTGFRTCAL